ncbi:AraC family transcriptional regulator [Stenotrophomonas sp. 24(2023)]|uniref:AraC family transcriptional regulator n=1 Tax=Stenotrophomonas sp. 24(2023) TaxID=3068324 RepID=UPI0027E03C7F|nr:AraC family transcriptional regulator [Stenotrophomonas sp. 24(2023)]WMJ68359.1 AraC family transcriptional regulator [Stenotrophomonas sp. 24(2023)]
MTPLTEFVNLLSRQIPTDGTFPTAVAGVTLIRWSAPSEPMPVVFDPTVCLVVQGRKRVSAGTALYDYDRARYLIASVAQPVMGAVIEASDAEPYLCVQIDLDMREIADLAMRHPARLDAAVPASALSVNETSPELLDAAARLVALLARAEDLPALAPLVLREIHYRLLTGPAGGTLRHMAQADSRLNQIGRAVLWIRTHFRQACRIEQAAEVAGMSRSSFHLHFRAVTSLTPIEFRTQLRLQEARSRMVADGMDAASAGFEVGYSSPSQFSRDYCRLFGMSPARDVGRLRAASRPAGAPGPGQGAS